MFVWLLSVSADPGGAAVLQFVSLSAGCEECELGQQARDLARGARLLLIWCLPGMVLLVSALIGGRYRAIVWPALLTWMAAACLMNARRCGRLHCYLTGPYFLLLALASLLHGAGIVTLGEHGWLMLSIALAIGGPFLVYVPERALGHYRTRATYP